MSNIARWKAAGGEWVRYADHRAEVERLTNEVNAFSEVNERIIDERDEALADAERLTAERDEARGEVERVKEKRDDYRAEFERLVVERDAHRFQVERLTTELTNAKIRHNLLGMKVEAERDAAQVEVERLKNAIDHLTSERDEARAERDAAQRERDRVQDLLTLAGRELSTLREALRVRRRRDQSAQNLDMVANCKETLTSSRPDDETIWREAFMSQLHDVLPNWATTADAALAEYRKRWPR